MKNAAGLLLICFALGVALVFAAGNFQDSVANRERARGEAQAQVLYAQGQASLNRAEAAVIRAEATTATMYAALPWAVLAVLGLLGLAVVSLAFVIVARPRQPERIETHILYLPPPHVSRQEIWRALEEMNRQTVVIPTRIDTKNL
jgi:hypothetical protein